jgi:hypothetical protein
MGKAGWLGRGWRSGRALVPTICFRIAEAALFAVVLAVVLS